VRTLCMEDVACCMFCRTISPIEGILGTPYFMRLRLAWANFVVVSSASTTMLFEPSRALPRRPSTMARLFAIALEILPWILSPTISDTFEPT
jgi:hypothetical protein